MELTETEVALLRHLYGYKYIGRKHTSMTNAIKCFPKSERGKAKGALENLVRLDYVWRYKSAGETHISLNTKIISEIREIIGKDSGGNYVVDVNDYYTIYPIKSKGSLFQIIIGVEKAIKSVAFVDKDKDGEYDGKYILAIPHKLDVLGVFPDPNKPKLEEDKFKKYKPWDDFPEELKKKMKEKGYFVYQS